MICPSRAAPSRWTTSNFRRDSALSTQHSSLQLHLLDPYVRRQVQREAARGDRLVDLDVRELVAGDVAVELGVLELRRQVRLLVDPDPEMLDLLGDLLRLRREVEHVRRLVGAVAEREVEVGPELVDRPARSRVLEGAVLDALHFE